MFTRRSLPLQKYLQPFTKAAGCGKNGIPLDGCNQSARMAALKDSIQIGNVEVPIADYAVGASAVLGIRDSGKTVTSKGIAEQLIEAGIPIIVFDAVGKWRWMKVAAEHSRGKAYKVVVAGGRDPDLPLTPHSVPEIVRAALKERIPLIIDLFSKNMSKSDWRQIVQTAIRIIHYENEGGAVHVFLEEAAEFVPQKVIDGQTYAEVEKLVRMGGNASVGITLINQRSQEVNKAVLDNCSTALVLGCQVGKNAIEAVEKWIERLDKSTAEAVTTSLPKLQAGEAWVWTRKSLDKPSREKMPMCRSFHPDRRTPEFVLKNAKPVDTASFVERMSASIPKVIEEAKANDPAELKAQIAKLKKELAAKPVETKKVEVSVMTKEDRDLANRVANKFDELFSALDAAYQSLKYLSVGVQDMKPHVVRIREIISRPQAKAIPVSAPLPSYKVNPKTLADAADRVHRRVSDSNTNGTLSGGMRRMMIALAQRPEGLNKKQLGVRAGLSSKSGTFGTYLSKLRGDDCIVEENGQIGITKHGLEVLGSYQPLPTGAELLAYWLNELGQGGSGRMLQVLAAEYPNTLSASELAEKAAMAESGTFGTYLSKLRSLELVTGSRNALKASDELFD